MWQIWHKYNSDNQLAIKRLSGMIRRMVELSINIKLARMYLMKADIKLMAEWFIPDGLLNSVWLKTFFHNADKCKFSPDGRWPCGPEQKEITC